MAVEVAEAYVSIIPSARGFGAKLAQQTESEATAAGDSTGGRFSDGFLGRIGKMAAAAAVTIGSIALVDFLKNSIGASSDLNESMNKVNVVFGDSAGEIQQWASTAATSMGQSQQGALEAAGTFGNLFTAMKIGQPQAATMSKAMVNLAGDLASFNNTSPEEALLALRSGLSGEIEPLRKFGVNLTDATLKAKAMELGLDDGKGVLTANARAQAAYALILEQTGTAQGDFARTSDGLANKQRILSAEAKDASAQLGTALLPAYLAIVGLLVEKVIPAVTQVITYLTEHKNVAIALGIAIGTILVVALAAFAAASIASAVAALAVVGPFLLIAAAVAGFIAVMVVLPQIVGRNIGAVVDIIANGLSIIGEFFVSLPGRILALLASIGGWLVDAGSRLIQGLISGILDAVPGVASFFLGLPAMILAWAAGLLGGLLQGHGSDLVSGIVRGLLSIIGEVANFFVSLPGQILSWAAGLLGGLLEGHGSNLIDGIVSGIFNVIGSLASAILALPGQVLSWAAGLLGGLLQRHGVDVVSGLVSGIASMLGAVASVMGQIPGIVIGAVAGAAGWLIGAGSAVIQGFISGIQGAIGGISGALGGIASTVMGAVSGAGSWLYSAGAAVVSGFVDGLRGSIGSAASAAASLASSVKNAAFSALGIGSPSKVFREIGVNVGEGFVQGIESMSGDVEDAIRAQYGSLTALTGTPLGMTANLGLRGAAGLGAVGPVRAGAASIVSSQGAPGGQYSINQTFNNSNVDAQQVARELSWTLLTRGR